MVKVLAQDIWGMFPKDFMPICKDTYNLVKEVMKNKNIGFETKKEGIEKKIILKKDERFVVEQIDLGSNSRVYGVDKNFYFYNLGLD